MEQYKLHIKAILDSLDPQHLPKFRTLGKKIRLLIEQFMQFRMLDLHVDRISDIVLWDHDASVVDATDDN